MKVRITFEIDVPDEERRRIGASGDFPASYGSATALGVRQYITALLLTALGREVFPAPQRIGVEVVRPRTR